MKQKLALTIFLLLMVLIAFGQNREPRNTNKSEKSIVENQMGGLKQDDHKILPNVLFSKSREVSQKLKQKSSSVINHKLDSLITQDWDEPAGMWINHRKEKYIYDEMKNMTKCVYYRWDETNNIWVQYTKEECTYDNRGQMTQSLLFDWENYSELWIKTSKYEYEYNINGNTTAHFNCNWDKTKESWVNYWKVGYKYDINQNRTQEIYYDWDDANNQWVDIHKMECSFDTNGYLTQQSSYNWDKTKGMWLESYKEDFINNSNGLLTQQIGCFWNETDRLWVNNYNYNYIYDDTGNLTMRISFSWDNKDNQWEASYKIEYSYDTNGNPDMEVCFKLDQITHEYSVYSKYFYSYDLDYNLSDLILPYLDFFRPMNSDKIVNRPQEYSNNYWDKDINDWVYNKVLYYYSEQITSTINKNSIILSAVYPNPFSQQLTFSFPENPNQITFELFNMQGHKIITKEVRNNETINVETLSNGVYLYNLFTDGKKHSGKLMKK